MNIHGPGPKAPVQSGASTAKQTTSAQTDSSHHVELPKPSSEKSLAAAAAAVKQIEAGADFTKLSLPKK